MPERDELPEPSGLRDPFLGEAMMLKLKWRLIRLIGGALGLVGLTLFRSVNTRKVIMDDGWYRHEIISDPYWRIGRRDRS